MSKLISLSELTKKTWSLYRQEFDTLIGLMAIPFLLFVISPFLIQVFGFLSLPLSLFLTLVAFSALVWAGVASIVVLCDAEEKLTLKEALKRGKIFFWPTLWVAIIVCFITGGATMLFLIPGLILTVYFVFAKLIVIVEKDRGLKSLVKSREYVRGYFWPVVGRYLSIVIFAGIIYWILDFIASSLVSSLVSSWSREAGEAILLVFQAVVNIVISPLALIATYLLYDDVRQKKGEILIDTNKKQAWSYLAIGIAGWVFLAIVIILAVVVLTSALGGFVLGSFVSDIFNSQVLSK